MGINARLEDERGQMFDEVQDPTNTLHRMLPDSSNETFCYVNCIDWYGDTVFNHLQAARFIAEWSRLEPLVGASSMRSGSWQSVSRARNTST